MSTLHLNNGRLYKSQKIFLAAALPLFAIAAMIAVGAQYENPLATRLLTKLRDVLNTPTSVMRMACRAASDQVTAPNVPQTATVVIGSRNKTCTVIAAP